MENTQDQIYIIGDVHGCYKTLLALVKQLPEKAKIVFVGDLINRGPQSKQVVDFVMKNGYDCVLGNHEDMMVNSEDLLEGNAFYYLDWINNGGTTTIESYTSEDGKFDKETFKSHVAWMKTLPLFLEYKDCKNKNDQHLLVSHSFAGNVFDWDEEKRKLLGKIFRGHLLWGRPEKFSMVKGVYNVFGHTVQDKGPKIKSFYANIDTGAVYKLKYDDNSNYLTALAFPSMMVYKQENLDNKSFYWK
jgi:serine/threonine protein phosphatase 1